MSEPRRIGRRALFGRLLAQREEQSGRWLKVHRTALASRFEVTLPSEDARHLDVARTALDEVDAIEEQLSWLRDSSEVSQLNRSAVSAPFPASPGLFSLLSLCRELHAATGGAFDPATTALARCWGLPDRRPRVPEDAEIEAARTRSGFDKVVLDGLSRTVRIAVPGVELAFGAIGRGWALDRIAANLRVRGVFRALVSAGGATHRGWGGQDWELQLRPGGEDLALLRLRDAALGTSAAGEQGTDAEGGRHGHVLDPRTGRPAPGVRSASVVTAEAAAADALSAAFLVGGADIAASFCASRRGTMALMVLDEAPREIRVFGKRDGVAVDTAAGVRLVETPG